MVIEDYGESDYLDTSNLFSISKGLSTNVYINSMEVVIPYFLTALQTHPQRSKLNENGLTQIFVTQLNTYLADNGYPFLVQSQYSDTYFNTKGIPDFFFYARQLNKDMPALFVVESKRLPSKTFETEYVHGEKKNGGIERFKIGKHGTGLKECGMLGFIEKEDCSFWVTHVNYWITELAKSDSTWHESEQLSKVYERDYLYSTSTAIIIKGNILLHHLWVKV